MESRELRLHDRSTAVGQVKLLRAQGGGDYVLARPVCKSRLGSILDTVSEDTAQSCKKITIFDRKDRDLFIDIDLWHDLDQFIDLLKLILIFDL